MKSCTDLFSVNEMNHVSLVTTTNVPPTTTATSADISTMDCLDETPSTTSSPSSLSPGNHQTTSINTDHQSDDNCSEHRTLPIQVDAASESTDTEVNVDTSGDSLLLGELMVGEEMIEDGGGRGEGREKEGGKDGGEEKVKERRKPTVARRYSMYLCV